MSSRVCHPFVLGCLILLCVPSFASADLAAPLRSYGNALISGTVELHAGQVAWGHPVAGAGQANQQFSVQIDYTVFEQGGFAGPLNTLYGDLSAGEYLYAYQLHNVGAIGDPSAASLRTMGVDLAGGNVTGIGYATDDAFTNPTAAHASGDAFDFVFSRQRIAPGHSSAILLVSSSDRWTFATMSLLSGGWSATSKLPSPGNPSVSPVPSAALLVLIGLGTLSTVRSRLIGGLVRAR